MEQMTTAQKVAQRKEELDAANRERHSFRHSTYLSVLLSHNLHRSVLT